MITLVVLWGIWALADGIGSFVVAFGVSGTGAKVLFALLEIHVGGG